jgi:hypothetical protein
MIEINQYFEVKSNDCHLNSLQPSQKEGNETLMITAIQMMLLYHSHVMLFSLFDGKLFPNPNQRFDPSNGHKSKKTQSLRYIVRVHQISRRTEFQIFQINLCKILNTDKVCSPSFISF